eukprot:CAMPEP_0206135302 /NCGR_PEP_ID=MMETSP1473-20131121/621_1 /ASSEMBLY_ACC=CAM_ASM_001109 /TAXON_ID=1461547 /ORGANISM="Stichococcus sp, Strain RCC1054" /LENGTH=137 /DNA_ID=CAMNT_0053527115 /DNA_START=273 /DNA_END=686 /DNA_ORIENTATION=+
MAGRLGPLGGLVRRIASPRSAVPLKGGGGGPVAFRLPPTSPLPEEDELLWDDGSATPEPCMDEFNLYSKWQALGALAGGMGFFVGVYQVAKWVDKPSKVPYAPREYPFANGLPLSGAALVKTPKGGDYTVIPRVTSP